MRCKPILILTILLLTVSLVMSAQRKTSSQIDTDDLTGELQVAAKSGDNHLNIVWWIPFEFWEATFSQDASVTDSEVIELLETMKKYSFLGIVQADISYFGSFNFYSKDEVLKSLRISYAPKGKGMSTLKTIKNPDPDVELILSVITPMLSAAMGNLGQNFHFFVLDDMDSFGDRAIDPYGEGNLYFEMKTKSGEALKAELEFPLNSLYISRKCPNGKDAHISWKFCPWTGKQLEP